MTPRGKAEQSRIDIINIHSQNRGEVATRNSQNEPWLCDLGITHHIRLRAAIHQSHCGQSQPEHGPCRNVFPISNSQLRSRSAKIR